MNSIIKIPKSIAIEAATRSEQIKTLAKAAGMFSNGPLRNLEVDLDELNPGSVTVLAELVKDKETPYAQAIRFTYSGLLTSTDTDEPLSRMSDIGPALRSYVSNTKRQWLFRQGKFNAVLAYLVTKIELGKDYSGSPWIRMCLHHSHIWSSSPVGLTITFDVSDLISLYDAKGVLYKEVTVRPRKDSAAVTVDAVMLEESTISVTIKDLLSHHGWFIESEGMTELYDKQFSLMERLFYRFGEQLEVRGNDVSGYNLLTEGNPSKCILDTIPAFVLDRDNDTEDEDEDDRPRGLRRSKAASSQEAEGKVPWEELRGILKSAKLEDSIIAARSEFHQEIENLSETPYVQVPMHFLLKIFHLEKYAFHTVHVKNLKPYKYKEGLDDKLILDPDVKDMTRMLVASVTDEDVDDIIEGKSQAVIITCIGAPGLGKTLLAEVLAEASKKPLYKVPADQLGMDSSSLEENLQQILRRTERWNCVLMIDEANAYIHTRGIDISQNALVGVFLRRLEYFKGVLVLTTNQTTNDGTQDIDDAILSRSNVVIEFKLPNLEQSAAIWKTQAELQKVKEKLDWTEVASAFPKRSGRGIRQLLRLSKRWAAFREIPLTLDLIKSCNKFVHK